MKQTLYILFVLLLLTPLSAQDLHFTQYNQVPTVLNPGLTGFLSGNYNRSFNLIYRNQWSSFLNQSAFETYGAAFQMRDCFRSESQRSRNNYVLNEYSVMTWGFGLTILQDEMGTVSVKDIEGHSPPLRRSHINLAGSLIIPLWEGTFLSGGFNGGTIWTRIPTDGLTFDEQFDGEAGFDRTIDGEFVALDNLNNLSWNIAGGLAFVHLQANKGVEIGGAVDHILKLVNPDLLDNEDVPDISRRFTVHAKYTQRVIRQDKRSYGIYFNGMFMHQSPYQQFVPGTGLYFQDDNSGTTVTFGTGLRNVRSLNSGRQTDALFFRAVVDIPRFAFGFSYDINTSRLNAASQHYGALEFSLTYRFKNTNNRCLPETNGPCEWEDLRHAIFY